MLAILLAAATPQTVIEAERAFAAAAQADGQWTAFRAYAAPDATMFVPQPVKAQEWLKERKDPKTAIAWSPTAAFVSCDGKWAATTGEWRLGEGRGYFSTVWRREKDSSWRWVVDSGDDLAVARPVVPEPPVRRASCRKVTASSTVVMPEGEAKMGLQNGSDGTFRYVWKVTPDGARTLTVTLWNGVAHETVVDDHIAAPSGK